MGMAHSYASRMLVSTIVLGLVVLQAVRSTAHDENEHTTDVIILGGGISGIFAAAQLEENGVNYLILEGSDQIGGRIRAGEIGNYLVELGSVWMHGPDNLFLPLANDYTLAYEEVNYDDWYVSDHEGMNVTNMADEAYERFAAADESLYEYEEAIRENDWPDMNRAGGLGMKGFTARTPIESVVEYFDIDFDIAGTPDTTTVKFSTTPVYDNGFVDYFTLHQDNGGFVYLLNSYAEEHISELEAKLKLNTVVNSVEYSQDNVTIRTSQGTYTAKYAIMTFSLGVLKGGMVEFDPPLPEWKQQAIFGFNYNSYTHFYLRFPDNESWFVPEIEWIVYADKQRGYYPIWLNMEVFLPGSRLLQGAVTGLEAQRISMLTDDEIMAEAMQVLRTMFGDAIPDPVEMIMHDWLTDPLSYGSYSDWPAGYTLSQHDSLRAPVGRLHFAGEAYSREYFAYMQGAAMSGRDTADKVTRCMNASPGSRQYAGCTSFVPSYMARGCTYEMALNYDPSAQEDDGSCWLVANDPPSVAHCNTLSTTLIAVISAIYCIFSKVLYQAGQL